LTAGTVNNPSPRNRALAVGLSISACLAVGWLLYLKLPGYVSYPPGPDQEEYLRAGVTAAERGVFFWKAPLYSLWLSLFYTLSGADPERSFYLEKAASIALLAGLTGFLARRIFDLGATVLATVWVLNCKYLLQEPNNSHTLTACLFTLGAVLVVRAAPGARLPLLLLVTYLATLVRAEMRLPLAAIIAWALLSILKPSLAGGSAGELFSVRATVLCAAIAIVIGSLFVLRADNESRYLLADEAFAQNFAANYVERLELSEQYPNPWGEAHAIMQLAMPGARTLTEAIIRYPAEVLRHAFYNVKVSIRAVPAAILGWKSKVVMALALMLYGCLCLFRRNREIGWYALDDDQRRMLIVWGMASGLLVLNTYLFRSAARYYIQLIPVLILGALYLWNRLCKIRITENCL
jgi:hypothetical protein